MRGFKSRPHSVAALAAVVTLGIALPWSVTGCAQPESTKLDTVPPAHVRPASVRMVAPRPHSVHLVLVQPARRTRLAPRLGGLLVDLPKKEQDDVEAGEVLAKLAAGDSKGGLIAAKATIQRIEESIRDNKSELATAKALRAKGVESARAVERLETSRATLKAQLREAKGQLLRARDAVGASTIEAPFAGTISAIETEVGEYLAPSVGAIVLVQLDPIAVEVPLTEREVAMHDRGGLSFAVTIRGETHPAELEWIAREADAGTSNFPARLVVENPEGTLRAGESAEVSVFGPAPAPQTAVPMTAIRWAADDAYVLRLVTDGKSAATDDESVTPNAVVERIAVEVRGDSEELVAVRGELTEGDRVVAAGPTRLVDGDAVVVVEDPKPSLAAR
ncbi:MAG: efflux RND transporter periplasmic adaptor subunit [Myxococcota bacterium]